MRPPDLNLTLAPILPHLERCSPSTFKLQGWLCLKLTLHKRLLKSSWHFWIFVQSDSCTRWLMDFGFRMQDFIPQARAHSLPDANPLPDVTSAPGSHFASRCNSASGCRCASGCESTYGCEPESLSSSLPPCQVISTEAPPRVYGAHLGPPYIRNTLHSQNDQNTLGFIKCK